jgi:flagellar biogenesis protein FliO
MSGVDATHISTMAMSLLAVIGLIVAGGFLLRRTPLGAIARQNGPLKVVATLPLGARERLVLVDARGAELLLAISPAGVFNVGHAEPGAASSRTGVELRAEAER